jgi:hypothetical protein
MARWLGILLAIGLASTSADAQVFKPKSKTTKSEKKSSSSEKKSSSSEKAEKAEKAEKSEKTEKKSARSSPSKKRVTTKPKKKHGADADEASDAPKESDKDFVQITDDDDVE